MSSYTQQISPSPSEQAQRAQAPLSFCPSAPGTPLPREQNIEKRAYTNKFRGACTLHTTTTTTYGDRETFHRSLPFPDRGPSSLQLPRSSKAVRSLLWGHPSATTTTGWITST